MVSGVVDSRTQAHTASGGAGDSMLTVKAAANTAALTRGRARDTNAMAQFGTHWCDQPQPLGGYAFLQMLSQLGNTGLHSRRTDFVVELGSNA